MSDNNSRFQKVFVGQAVQKMDSSPDWGSYSKIILRVSEDEGYVAGDDSGLTLEADCPWATQAMADNLLASLQGKSYKPYDGKKAIITPAAEIGDGMTSDGFYSGIYSLSRTFSKLSAADIAAPMDTEVQHEFQYIDANDRRFVRKMKEIQVEFQILNDRMVAKVGGDNSQFGWEMIESGMTWWANGSKVMEVDKDGLSVTGTIKGGSVLTGNLYIGEKSISDMISAATLRDGANSGYNWANGGYGGYGSRWDYSLTGGGFGFNYNGATQYSGSYPDYFGVTTGLRFRHTLYTSTVQIQANNGTFQCIGAVVGGGD